MDAFIKGVDRRDTLAILQANAVGKEEIEYRKHLSPDEVEQHKTKLAENMIIIKQEDSKLDEAKAYHKEKTKPYKKQIAESLEKIKEQSELVTESCFKFVDTNAKEVGYYNSLGELVYSRKAMMDELQIPLQFGPASNEQYSKTGSDY
jgi:hypothetical protein